MTLVEVIGDTSSRNRTNRSARMTFDNVDVRHIGLTKVVHNNIHHTRIDTTLGRKGLKTLS